MTNLGASLGTALVGAVLISSLTAGLLHGIEASSAIPADVKTHATTQLAGGVPFISDTDLQAQLAKASIPPEQATAVVNANSDARLAALRDALWIVAVLAVTAMFLTGLIPTEPTGQPTKGESSSRPALT